MNTSSPPSVIDPAASCQMPIPITSSTAAVSSRSMNGPNVARSRVATICAAKAPRFSVWKRLVSDACRSYACTSAALLRLSSATAEIVPVRRRFSREAALMRVEK